MPIYQLPEEPLFPNPEMAEEDGLLAVGGDLSPERLLNAYSQGIFPWYSEGQPLLWWSPDPRMLLFPKDFKRSKSLSRTVQSDKFQIKFDRNFEEVINHCSKISRKGQPGTWITEEMKNAYINLHQLGFAHSVETYLDEKLLGGLYGISLGGAFFGESMFHLVTDASKVALWNLVDRALEWNFDFIDVQQDTEHLRSLGAVNVDRKKFLILLSESLKKETRKGNWGIG
ncbi:MAG: leucyl/phenylalanyl-tRNA--protein transferase [Bacteroidetes bacterium]|nr:MAG: leucyl/phenylalanyl-tRNA--protein transferase [Bacteroidota bacterium]